MQYIPLCALVFAACLDIKNHANCEQEDEEIVMVGNNVCVTNGPSAIIFNPPIEDMTEHITVSEVFPSLGESKENGIFFRADKYGKSALMTPTTATWQIVNSIEYLHDIVTDRRWETFPIYKNYSLYIHDSVYLRPPSPYYGRMPSTSRSEDFSISVSARLEYQGAIYLCDTSIWSDCIRISLQPYRIQVDFCKMNRTRVEANDDCLNLAEEDILEKILDEDLWTHFRIDMTDGRLTFVHSGMEHLDFDFHVYDYITPNRMDFKTPLGFWKSHSYDFLYTDQMYNDVLGPTITPVENQICLDMFTVMCKYCRLQISIKEKFATRLFKRVYRTPDEKWTRVLIRLNDVKSEVALHIKTMGEVKGQFWALDDIRLCNFTNHGNQFRYIKTDQPNSPCQKVGLISQNIWNHHRNDISEPHVNCGPDEVGTLCAPCRIFTNARKCHNFRYCEYVDDETACRCVNGRNCVNEPPVKSNYSLKLIKSGPQFCQLSVDFHSGPTSYTRTKYRKENETEWRTRKSYNKISPENTYTLGHLDADTTYEIRSVIDDYVDDDAETVLCHTSCKYLVSDDITITPNMYTATIHIRFDPQVNCPLSNYFYKMNNQSVRLSETLHISNLNSYQQYGLVIGCMQLRGCHTVIYKDFTTLGEEEIPRRVRNLNVTLLESNYARLSWDVPYSSGEIQKYNITCYMLDNIKCERYRASDHKARYETTNNTSFILYNLRPFTSYEGTVVAVNKLGAGPTTFFSFTTKALEKILRSELVKIQYLDKTANTITVSVSQLLCEKYQGEHFYYIDVSCSMVWCVKKLPSIMVEGTKVTTIMNLHPFVNYTVKLSISRTRTGAKILSDTKIIATDSSDPNKVTIEVTTSGTTIGLRWKPPFPPTGILDGYILRTQNASLLITTNGTPCLWPGYHCATIKNLELNVDYFIELSALNKGRNYTTIGEIHVVSKEGEPDVPDLWSASWFANNTLRLSWNHPNNTRGVLRQFVIKIDSKIFTIHLSSEEDYKATYKYELQSNRLPRGIWCSYFPINLFAVNNFSNNSAVWWVYSPPPLISGTVKALLVTETNIKVRVNWTEGVILKSMDFKLGRTKQNGVAMASCRLSNVKGPVVYDFHKNCGVILQPHQKYTVQVIMINDCSGQKMEYPRTQFVTLVVTTKGISTAKYGAFVLFTLPLVLFLYCYFRKRKAPPVPSENKADKEITFKCMRGMFANPKKIFTRRNLSGVTYSKDIKIKNLEKYIKKSIRSGELQQQFDCFKGFKALCENIPQQDESQNALITFNGAIDECSKYVDVSNASFVDGYNAKKAYIVTQVPKQCALQKFWKMVWQEKIENIVTVMNVNETGTVLVNVNGIVFITQFKIYWPDVNEEKHYGPVKVRYESSSVFVNFEIRIFEIFFGTSNRKITQWHFTSWPDQGIPLYSHNLAEFLKRVSNIPYKANSPILVHCSGGIGVSGTIVLSDVCLRMATGGTVDFLARLKNLRELRPDLVENVEQYILVHLVVYECLFRRIDAMKCNDNMPNVVGVLLTSNAVQAEMEYLETMTWLDDAVESTMGVKGEVSICPEKNRFKDVEPGKYRVILPRYPSTNDTSSYINAVQVNGFRNKPKYIITQQPLPNTIGDFWRMVIDNKSTVIVSLNEIDPHDKTICQFWPEEGYDLPVDFLNISHVKEQQKKHYKIVTLRVQPQLTAMGDFNLNIIQVHKWKAGTLLPGSVEELLSIEEEAEVRSNKSHPTIVTCYDGATACGLYLAMALVMEKMKLERECDVSLAVRTIRHYRKQFIKEKVQYEFLYKAAVAYLEEFKPYPKIVAKQ